MRFLRFLSRKLFATSSVTSSSPHLLPYQPSGGLLEVKVLKVVDGDTIEALDVKGSFRIRLDAIDCPEGCQPWGENAKDSLKDLVGGRAVYLETHGEDRYGRVLATVYVMVGTELINVNERMVMNGHAWVSHAYYRHLSRGRQRQLNILERWARRKRVGLWKAENPIAPWRWRHHSCSCHKAA